MKTDPAISKPAVEAAFGSAAKSTYAPKELSSFIRSHAESWGLPAGFSISAVLKFLLAETVLRQVVLRSEKYDSQTRYVWGAASVHQIALSLRRGAYLSHGSAVFLHGLTDQIPKTIYVNHEQSPKPASAGTLTQERVDLAFSRPQRMSSYEFRLDRHRVVLLSGKNTNRLEVGTIESPEGEALSVTKLERTLIDIVVRPAYAGGIFQVLEAFKTARERVSVGTLLATLKAMRYIYPYHQAIGFLMARAGYEQSLCARVGALGMELDFYLIHGMKKKQYDPEWRLFYPEGLTAPTCPAS